MMSKEELIAFLLENLSVDVNMSEDYGNYSDKFVRVEITLKLGEEVISSSSDSINLSN